MTGRSLCNQTTEVRRPSILPGECIGQLCMHMAAAMKCRRPALGWMDRLPPSVRGSWSPFKNAHVLTSSIPIARHDLHIPLHTHALCVTGSLYSECCLKSLD